MDFSRAGPPSIELSGGCAIMALIGGAAIDKPASIFQILSKETLHGEDPYIG
jgi:hypothetical protein